MTDNTTDNQHFNQQSTAAPEAKPKKHPAGMCHEVVTEHNKTIWQKPQAVWAARNGYMRFSVDGKQYIFQPWPEYEKHYLKRREAPAEFTEHPNEPQV